MLREKGEVVEMRSSVESRWNTVLVVALVLFMLTAWMVVADRSEAASAPLVSSPGSSDLVNGSLAFQADQIGGLGGNIFAKYEGVPGESVDANHDEWSDVLSMEWGVESPTGPATGVSRRRGAPIIEDLVLTYLYDKSTPKLVEKLLKGEVIPMLEVELTNTWGDGGATYLRYELKNVMLTSYYINASADGGPPTVVVGNNFEEIKVTYTPYDDEGNSESDVEYTWKVEKGA